eukprot:1149975-Pelagomonas_calceolata.AAC.6
MTSDSGKIEAECRVYMIRNPNFCSGPDGDLAAVNDANDVEHHANGPQQSVRVKEASPEGSLRKHKPRRLPTGILKELYYIDPNSILTTIVNTYIRTFPNCYFVALSLVWQFTLENVTFRLSPSGGGSLNTAHEVGLAM